MRYLSKDEEATELLDMTIQPEKLKIMTYLQKKTF